VIWLAIQELCEMSDSGHTLPPFLCAPPFYFSQIITLPFSVAMNHIMVVSPHLRIQSHILHSLIDPPQSAGPALFKMAGNCMVRLDTCHVLPQSLTHTLFQIHEHLICHSRVPGQCQLLQTSECHSLFLIWALANLSCC